MSWDNAFLPKMAVIRSDDRALLHEFEEGDEFEVQDVDSDGYFSADDEDDDEYEDDEYKDDEEEAELVPSNPEAPEIPNAHSLQG